MCNIAAYVGDQRAAPLLFEMMKKEEGFAGGFYTGLATLHDGALHYDKVIGDVAQLEKKVDVGGCPGSVGFIHSRHNGGGNVEWGHPFVDAERSTAYCANGHHGIFLDMRAENETAAKLFGAGCRFASARDTVPDEYENAPQLPDGNCIHSSELKSAHVSFLAREYGDPVKAFAEVATDCPSETVSLVVHTAMPDCILVARISQPMMFGKARGGIFCATTALAFPETGIEWVAPCPHNTVAVVRADSIECHPFTPRTYGTHDIFPWAEGYARIVETIRKPEGADLNDLKKATRELWPAGKAPQNDMMIYEVLRSLCREGKIRFEIIQKKGIEEGTQAPSVCIHPT